jgi:hypothetical protein
VARSLYTGMTTESFIGLHRSVVEECSKSKVQVFFSSPEKCGRSRCREQSIMTWRRGKCFHSARCFVSGSRLHFAQGCKSGLDAASPSVRFFSRIVYVEAAQFSFDNGHADSCSEQ